MVRSQCFARIRLKTCLNYCLFSKVVNNENNQYSQAANGEWPHGHLDRSHRRHPAIESGTVARAPVLLRPFMPDGVDLIQPAGPDRTGIRSSCASPTLARHTGGRRERPRRACACYRGSGLDRLFPTQTLAAVKHERGGSWHCRCGRLTTSRVCFLTGTET